MKKAVGEESSHLVDVGVLKDVKYKEVGGVAVITMDSEASKVNTLGSALIPQFESIFQRIESSPLVKSVVIICQTCLLYCWG